MKNQPSEECDGTDFGFPFKTCQDFGYDGGTLECTSECTYSYDKCETVDIALVPGSLEATHVVGQSPCPQVVGTVLITNNSNVEIDWLSRDTHPALDVTPFQGSLKPGESVTLTVAFNCSTQTSFIETFMISAGSKSSPLLTDHELLEVTMNIVQQ